MRKGTLGRSHNIGGENERNNVDIVSTICALFWRVPVRSTPARLITFLTVLPGHDYSHAIDTSCIRTELVASADRAGRCRPEIRSGTITEDLRNLDRALARELEPGSKHYSAYVGPAQQWDIMGATQFRLLTTLGLREHHRLLDIGCGALRAGRLLIPYLNRDCYYGIEPNTWLVEDAIAAEVGPEMIERKGVKFDNNSDFNAGVFGVSFDFVLAQSIFSHAGPDLVGPALVNIAGALAPGGLFLATFLCTDLHPKQRVEVPGWVYPGCLAFRPETIATLASAAQLVHRRLPWFHPRQIWYAFAAAPKDLPDPTYDSHLSGGILRAPDFQRSLGKRK